ncbi:hypothetical protein BCF50_1798 [Chryseobacterium daecheongense]|uniref:Uncharacterized protein n=1 Tax=Chryseobacterium daecheongense TaxID=192389 RepID=A0ABY2FVY4_9FLAO|nr:hypothetical protein BCF50_1798 [Chryseobacterium daecheongense]
MHIFHKLDLSQIYIDIKLPNLVTHDFKVYF